MGLWIAIAAFYAFLWLVRPVILARMVAYPARRPDEAQRRVPWRKALGRLGFELSDWRLLLTPGFEERDKAGEPLKKWAPETRLVAEHVKGGRPAASDELSLALWSAIPPAPEPGEPRKKRPLVVLIHGYSNSSASMGDAALTFARRGFGVVFVDVIGHGFSGHRPCSYGKREAYDIRALLWHLAKRPEASEGFVLAGWSMGGAIAMLAMAAMPSAERSRVRGAVFGAAFHHLRPAMVRHGRTGSGIKNPAIIRRALRRSEKLADFKVDDVSPKTTFKRLRAKGVRGFPPAFFVKGEDDELVYPGEMASLAALWPGPSRHVEVPGVMHEDLWDHAETLRALAGWIDEEFAPALDSAAPPLPARKKAPGANGQARLPKKKRLRKKRLGARINRALAE